MKFNIISAKPEAKLEIEEVTKSAKSKPSSANSQNRETGGSNKKKKLLRSRNILSFRSVFDFNQKAEFLLG